MASRKSFASLAMFAVIYAADYALVKSGDFCDVMLLGWDANREKAVKAGTDEAKYDGREGEDLLVLYVEVTPEAKMVPTESEPSIVVNGYIEKYL